MSSCNKTYKFIIVMRIVTICFICLQNAYHIHGLTEEQIREVEQIRAELNEAFEREEEINLEDRGVIVQPEWTQHGKSEQKVNNKVVVNDAVLQETKRLRDEISKAIDNDIYVVSSTHSRGGDTRNIQKLQKSLSLQGHGRDVLDIMLSSSQNSGVHGREQAEQVGAALDDTDNISEGPNIVKANTAQEYDIDIGKLQRLEFSKRRTKEMLVLKSIEEDYNFDLGDDVLGWAFIQHDGKPYFIGRREQDLLIVRQEDLNYEKGNVVEVGYPITYVETYSYWNLAQQKQEGIIIVAARDNVLWYRGNNETHQIELYWDWSIGRAITGLTYFKIDSNDYLAVSTSESSRSGYYTLNIYQFDLHAQEFWITQRLQLQFPCQEVALIDTGRDIVLSVAQNGTAAIYTFNPRAMSTEQIRFQLRTNIPSEGIQSITAFKMGGRSYLALGGMQPQILQYQQGEFIPKTIFGQNFGLVELFFPIPVRTYRDDLILLIQHRVDFGTHKLTELEALIWNGESFETSIPVPCQLGTHTFYGVNCMLDIQRDDGLKGAAFLKRGDKVSLIVPRHKAESGLFVFHTELLARNSEVRDLEEIYTFLKDWVKEQDELIAQAQAFVEQPEAEQAQQMPDLSELQLVKTPELEFTGNIGEIYVNDYRWTEEDTDADLDLLIQSIEELGQELLSGRFRRDLNDVDRSYDLLNFDEVETDELVVDLLNGETFYIQDGVLNFDGTLAISNLKVLEHAESTNDEFENVEIEGRLEFEEINGVPWQKIKQGLVFRNSPINLKELEVDGEVVLEDHLTIKTLNSLNFPEDYLWSSGPRTSIVKAEKTFLGNLSANGVDTEGLINGMNPLDAVTLSDPQHWSGTTTFTTLKVLEKLDLNGTARGRGLDEFESNPTLLESNIIGAACNFAQLEVHGPVLVKGKFENIQLSELLSDIVKRSKSPEKEIVISSKKSFTDIAFPIDTRIKDNKVNEINIDQFVTVHTNQDLDITTLAGYIYFNNLTMDGAYDGVVIDELIKNSIKVDEPTYTLDTQMNFIHPITANNVTVSVSLNDVPIATGYQTLLEDLSTSELIADDLVAKIGDIRGDIEGNGKFNGLNLREFLEYRTWTESTDTGNIFLDELTLEKELITDSLHGINSEFLLSFLDKIDEIPEMILDGKIQVDHVIVSGDVQVHKLNGQNFDEDIQLTAIWLNRPNYLSTNLQFLEPVVLQSDLYCEGNLNGEDLPALINDMVFRNANKTVLINAPKKFLKNVIIAKNVNLDAINGLPFEHIATKRGPNHFNGTVHLNGNLYVSELELSGYLNGFSMANLSNLVRFDRDLSAYVLLGEVSVPTKMQLHDLSVQGNFNNFTSVGQFFKNMVYKNKNCMLRGNNVFTGRVSIERGAYIRNLNDYNLMALLNNIVYIRETQPININSRVEFKAPVTAQDITVRESINATNLNGCSLLSWLNDTLRVDHNENITELLQFAPFTLDGNSFYAGFWNDVNLSQIITLHTPQNLSNELLFSELYLDGTLEVAGLINNVDLKMEYENTLMNHGDQNVTTPLTLPSCRVLNSLQTNAPVNGNKDLNQLALLNEPLELRSPLFFQNVTVKNLHTKDLVSGINLDNWRKNALWLNERPQQWITGNWTVRTLNVITDLGNDMLEPLQQELARRTREQDNFYEISQKVAKILRKREQRATVVKYLEEAKELAFELRPENENINRIFSLAFKSTKYLLVNTGCIAYMYSWNSNQQRFENVTNFESGYIDQVIAVPALVENSTLRFIINAADADVLKCRNIGVNTWTINGNNSAASSNSNNVSRLHQIPNKPFFYYALIERDSVVHELSIFDGNTTKKWSLPTAVEDNCSHYRFLPTLENSSSVNLGNGLHILLLQESNDTASDMERTKLFTNQSLAVHGMTKKLARATESILKPNMTALSSKLSFVDFQRVVERRLDELIYRLNIEVNIIQLSIPESDLYDEHLVQDFIAVVQKLQQQRVLPAETFAKIDSIALDIPANPAQVLAARTLQLVWPIVVEITDTYSNLSINETQTHSHYGNITNSLAVAIQDVLVLAYNTTSNKTKDSTKSMSAVIERIHQLQSDIKKLVEIRRLNSQDEKTATTEAILGAGITSLSNSDSSILIAPGYHIPCLDKGEVIAFQVGARFKPHILTALIADTGKNNSIKLYTDYIKAELFQNLEANEPRALAALRIGDETLLALVENCCTVRVLIYRGVQGFVDFAKFTLNESIQNIIGLKLPMKGLYARYFFAVSNGKCVKFYEVILAGNKKIVKKN